MAHFAFPPIAAEYIYTAAVEKIPVGKMQANTHLLTL
jgi:hypothetical protein